MSRGKFIPCSFDPPCNAELYESKVATHRRRQHRSQASEENIRKLLEVPEDIDHSRISRFVNSSELACLHKAVKKAYIEKVAGPQRAVRDQREEEPRSSVFLEETYYTTHRDHSEEGLIDLEVYDDDWGTQGDSDSDEDQWNRSQVRNHILKNAVDHANNNQKRGLKPV